MIQLLNLVAQYYLQRPRQAWGASVYLKGVYLKGVHLSVCI